MSACRSRRGHGQGPDQGLARSWPDTGVQRLDRGDDVRLGAAERLRDLAKRQALQAPRFGPEHRSACIAVDPLGARDIVRRHPAPNCRGYNRRPNRDPQAKDHRRRDRAEEERGEARMTVQGAGMQCDPVRRASLRRFPAARQCLRQSGSCRGRRPGASLSAFAWGVSWTCASPFSGPRDIPGRN